MGRICCMTCCFIQRVPGFETTSVMVKWTLPQWVGMLSTPSCVLQSSWLIGWGQSPLHHAACIPRYVYYSVVMPRVYCQKKMQKRKTCYNEKASSFFFFHLDATLETQKLCVSQSGHPGLPISISLYYLCGLKARLNLNLGIENWVEVESGKQFCDASFFFLGMFDFFSSVSCSF